MKYGFINNLSTELAVAITAGSTEIELAAGADGVAAALQGSEAVALTLLVVDSAGEETKKEIVNVTAATPPLLTVTRAQEGTTAQSFAAGDKVEGRLTAGALSSVPSQSVNQLLDGTIVSPQDAAHDTNPNASTDTIVIGNAAIGLGNSAVAIGTNAEATLDSISIGRDAKLQGGDTSILIGKGTHLGTSNSVLLTDAGPLPGPCNFAVVLGMQSQATSDGVAVGYSALCEGAMGAMAAGRSAYTGSTYSLVVGGYSATYGNCGTSLGAYAGWDQSEAYSVSVGAGTGVSAEGGIAIGAGAMCNVRGGLAIHGLSYLSSVRAEQSNNDAYAGLSTPNAHALQSAMQVVYATTAIDLTDGTATAVLDLPPNTILLPDSFDVVVVAADAAAGTPEIQIGPDDATPAGYLAATPVGKTVVGGREKHAPLIDDGVTSLRVAVATAGSGTTYQAKVVVRGYVMEV